MKIQTVTYVIGAGSGIVLIIELIEGECTVVMITEMVGGEEAGADVMTGGVVVRGGALGRGGAGWNIMVKGGITEARARQSCEHPKKCDISPLKTQKTPEHDKDKKQKCDTPSPKANKPSVTGPPPPQRVNPPSQSQSQIKPSDSDNPIEAKPIEKSDAKDRNSYFEIFKKGYKPPIKKQKNEEDDPYLQVFIRKSELDNYCNYKGTVKQGNTIGALFSIAQNLLTAEANVAKKRY